MRRRSQKILFSLPEQLLNAIDVVKTEKQISRSAFIRESLTRNLLYYHKYERGPVCFPRDEVELNDTGPSEHPVGIREEKGEP